MLVDETESTSQTSILWITVVIYKTKLTLNIEKLRIKHWERHKHQIAHTVHGINRQMVRSQVFMFDLICNSQRWQHINYILLSFMLSHLMLLNRFIFSGLLKFWSAEILKCWSLDTLSVFSIRVSIILLLVCINMYY